MSTEYVITLCDGHSCTQNISRSLKNILHGELERHGLQDRVSVQYSGCLGICNRGPVMVIMPGYTVYGNVAPADVKEIIESHLVKNEPVTRLVVEEDHLFNRFFRIFGDVHFFGKQMRIALRNCGIIAAGAAAVSPQGSSGRLRLRKARPKNTSSAMPTRETPGHSWTGA